MVAEPMKRPSYWLSSLVSLGILGAAAGLLTGMSESPVGAVIVGALFGLLGGGGVFALFGRPQDRLPSPERIKYLSWGLSTLCASCVVAVFVGIALREGYLSDWSRTPEETLLNLQDSRETLTTEQLTKLVLLQAELESLAVPRKQNNLLVGSFLMAGRVARGVDPDRVGDILGYARDIAGYNKNYLHNSLANASSRIEQDLAAIERMPVGEQARALTSLLKDIGSTVRSAADTANGIGTSAEKLSELLRVGTQPDLSLVLDLVSRYKQAQLSDQELRIGTPAWRRRGAYDSPSPGISIKP